MTDLTNYKRFERIYTQHRELRFYRLDEKPRYGPYYAFEVDANGEIDLEALTPIQRESLMRASDRTVYHEPELVEYETTSTIPAHGTCTCGELVWCDDPLWNSCQCGRYYNMSGQEVNPPHSGPYETGEMYSDIYLGRDEDY